MLLLPHNAPQVHVQLNAHKRALDLLIVIQMLKVELAAAALPPLLLWVLGGSIGPQASEGPLAKAELAAMPPAPMLSGESLRHRPTGPILLLEISRQASPGLSMAAGSHLTGLQTGQVMLAAGQRQALQQMQLWLYGKKCKRWQAWRLTPSWAMEVLSHGHTGPAALPRL